MDNLVLDIQFSAESATEPVSLQQAKNWLKVDIDDDDALITELITSARQDCENYLCMSLIARTVTACLNIGLGEIPLPYGPINDVISVKNIATGEMIESFVLKYNNFKSLDPCTEVEAVYTAGFDDGQCPKSFVYAILMQTAWQYEHRGDDLDQQTNLSPGVMRKLKPYRRVT